MVEEANKNLLRERDREVEGLLSTGPSDGEASGTIRTVLSLSCEEFLALKLLSESKVLMVDLMALAEFGLGGSPLLEPGLDINVGPSVLLKDDNAFSTDLAGICREERLGLLEDSGIKEVLSPIPFPAQV